MHRPALLSNLVLLLLCASLAGCASRSSLGSVPGSLVMLLDQASPDGVAEIEVGRDGRIRKMEVDIPIESVPPHIVEAALAQVDGLGIVMGAERELLHDGYRWEVKVRAKGRNFEFIYDDQGNLREIEQELFRDEAPERVLQAADRALPGGTFRSVELVQTFRRGDVRSELYHVKKLLDGASYKLEIAPDGRVLRRAREHRAEIEIELP